MSSEAPQGYNRVMVQDGPKKRPKLEPDPDSSQVVRAHVRPFGGRQVDARYRPHPQRRGHHQPQGKALGQNQRPRDPHQRDLHWHIDLGRERQGRGPIPCGWRTRFPAIISTAQFNRVSKLLQSRAPKIVNPRRVASPFLLSGLVKCKSCRRALTGQCSKYAQFTYYVCQTLMKQGKGSCDAPRLNARRFEVLVVEKIRSNIFTESSIPDLVKAVDEEMDRVAAEQHKRLEAIDAELEDVKRHLSRIWHFIGETDNVDMADAGNHIRELRDRQKLLEDEASAAREILTQRRFVLDNVNTIEAYAKEMRDFLKHSELTERKAFIQSFVKEIVVMPGDALLRYTVPMPSDSLIPGKAIEKLALNDPVLVSEHRSPLRETRTSQQYSIPNEGTEGTGKHSEILLLVCREQFLLEASTPERTCE